MPTSPPCVSIVVPVFNADRFLATTIGSVKAQTLRDWELILVDDGSTDDSRALCRSYAAQDDRIKVIVQENSGPAAARNTGVRAAAGEFICFLDADDILFPDALTTLLSAAHGVDLVMGNFCKQEDDSIPIPRPVILHPDGMPFTEALAHLSAPALLDYIRHFLKHPSNHLVSYCWARLYRHEAIRQHGIEANADMRLFEDFAFNLDFLGATRSWVFVNAPVYVYVLRAHHASASMAILNAHQLISDMGAARRRLDMLLKKLSVDDLTEKMIMKEAGHMLIHYAIIFLVRTCRHFEADHRAPILREIRALIESDILQESLPHYRPSRGASRVLPLLMRLKFPWLLAVVSRMKGIRRYGRLKG